MRAAALLRAGGLAAVAALGMLAITALPGPAGSASAATETTGPPTAALAGQQATDFSNVGATHSPQLLRELAGPAGSTGLSASTIAGAISGVDVASYQHPAGKAISWPDVAAAGIRFAEVKATEGAYYQNPYALTDLAQAQAAGLAVGAYAFAIPNGGSNGNGASPVTQADYFVSYLGSASRTVPAVLDIEYDPNVGSDHTNQCYGLTPAAMVSWVSAYVTEIQHKTGRLPIIYTPISWWNTCAGGSTAFSQLPLWVPAYTSAASPGLPAGWGNWSIWQYTSTGTVPGIDYAGHTDLDQLNPGLFALLDPGNQRGSAGSSVYWRVKPAVPVAGQTASYSGSGLPPGIMISHTGRVTGWPDRPGTYAARVTAKNSQGVTGSVSFTWTVTRAADAGPVGAIRLNKGGMCLHDAGNRSASGTPVNIWTCNGGAAEQWTVVKDDTVRIHGMCLAVPGRDLAELRTCSGSGAQHWLAGTRGRLINPASGECLTDPAGSTRNGQRVALRSCTGKADQQWGLPAGPVVSQIPGRCLDDSKDGRTSGTPVDLWTCNGSDAQAWRARPDGTVRIHSKCLAATQSGTVSGALVELRDCSGSRAQQWRMPADRGGVSLVNAAAGLCLADPGDATADGTRLQVVTCSASAPGMAWRVH